MASSAVLCYKVVSKINSCHGIEFYLLRILRADVVSQYVPHVPNGSR